MHVMPDGFDLKSLYKDSAIIPWPVCIDILYEAKPFQGVGYLAMSDIQQEYRRGLLGVVKMMDSIPEGVTVQRTDAHYFGEVDINREFDKALLEDPDETKALLCTTINNPLIPELEFNLREGGSYTLRFGGRVTIEWKVFENKDVYHTCRCFFSRDQSHVGFILMSYNKDQKRNHLRCDQEKQPSFPGIAPSDVYRIFVVKMPSSKEDMTEFLMKLREERDRYFRYDPEDPPVLNILEFGLENHHRH